MRRCVTWPGRCRLPECVLLVSRGLLLLLESCHALRCAPLLRAASSRFPPPRHHRRLPRPHLLLCSHPCHPLLLLLPAACCLLQEMHPSVLDFTNIADNCFMVGVGVGV